jgi:hypothetical protein
MAQRIYWVPHTVCFFGCEHCRNDSVMEGIRADRAVIDGVVANLPAPGSRYALEEILIGGGESLMRNQQMEYLIVQMKPTVLSERERRFYTAHLGATVMNQLFTHDPSLTLLN